jgi:hypothetical protein
MRIVTLLARHATRQYADAIGNIDALFASQLPRLERDLVVVDTSLPQTYEKPLGSGRVLIGGSNESWEFSAWDRGLAYLGRRIHDYDFVHLATSAFKALESQYLDHFDEGVLALLANRAAALGHVDFYPEPVILLGQSSQAWLRSSWTFVPPSQLDLLGSLVSIDDRAAFFSGNPDSPFRPDAPLSANYQKYILDWLTGGGIWDGLAWHSRFRLTDEKLAYFEAKALAVMNEQTLSTRLRLQGCDMVDVTWLAQRRAGLAAGDSLGPIPGWRSQMAHQGIGVS